MMSEGVGSCPCLLRLKSIVRRTEFPPRGKPPRSLNPKASNILKSEMTGKLVGSEKFDIVKDFVDRRVLIVKMSVVFLDHFQIFVSH